MGLTSRVLALSAAGLAVLFFAVTVWLWPGLARRNAPAVLGRIGLLLATQLALVTAMCLFVNQSFGFYASWSDLLGRDRQQGVVVTDATAPVILSSGTVPSIGGRTELIQLTGEVSRIATPAYIYLPPEYFQTQYARRTFPAAVVLTGYPGIAQTLVDKLDYPSVARSEAAAGRMQPTILVMLRPTLAPPRDTECMDVPDGPQTETFFTRDLPAELSHRFRIGRHARNWGIIGDSTGGYCALKLAMRHPEVFTAAASLSGYYRAPLDPTTGALFGGNARRAARLARANDLLWRLRHLPHPPVSLLVTSSRQGERDYAATVAFIRAVRRSPPAQISSIILASGGHNFGTWSREIPGALTWLASHLSDR
jgi:S-formylglutathione hydrolase FrmB